MSLFINKEISLFQEEGYSPDKYFEPDVNSNILSPKFNFTRAPESKEERDKWVKVARENILDIAGTARIYDGENGWLQIGKYKGSSVTRYNPNELSMSKNEVDKYSKKAIDAIKNISNLTVLEKMKYWIESKVEKYKLFIKNKKKELFAKKIFETDSIFTKIYKAYELLIGYIIKIFLKIIGFIVSMIAKAHRYVKDKYYNSKYKSELSGSNKGNIRNEIERRKAENEVKYRTDVLAKDNDLEATKRG